jgi:Fe-S-cluster containining protein
MPSLCDTCRSPGACCKSFTLMNTDGNEPLFPVDSPSAPLDYLEAQDLPFLPVLAADATVSKTGEPRVVYSFTCLALGPNGRCRMYERRPTVCRAMEAGKNPLCVHYDGPIPVDNRTWRQLWNRG